LSALRGRRRHFGPPQLLPLEYASRHDLKSEISQSQGNSVGSPAQPLS
jgi:hypothetical protein